MKNDFDFNVKFIELIRERPCLYDYTRSEYNNRFLQDDAWTEVAKILNESVTDCKEKWRSIRGCYTRHLKKTNRPFGSSPKFVRPYYLANQMTFLERFTKPKPTGEIVFKIEENQTTPNETYEDYENDEESRDTAPSPLPMEKLEICSREAESYSRQDQAAGDNKRISLNEVCVADMEYYQPTQKIPKYDETQDPDFAFFYSILPDIKDMNPDQKRRFKIGVIKLASDILREDVLALPSNQN